MRIRSIRDLAATIRGRRRELGLTQADLAMRAGVSRKWVYEFEAGKPAAELQLILRVMDALGLALDVGYTDGARHSRGTMVDLDTLIEEHRAR
jgi:HTH-type transcriptional regulator/antitoxin HipB